MLLADTHLFAFHHARVHADKQLLGAEQLAQLAAALPACTELTADLHVDLSSQAALAALVRLSEARCVRLGRVRITSPFPSFFFGALAIDGPGGLPLPLPPLTSPLREAHAAALGALLRASAAAGTLCGVFFQRVSLSVQSLATLADALEQSAASMAIARLAFEGCDLDAPTADVRVAALSRLLRAAGGVTAAAADSCTPSSAWAEAFGMALEGGAPFAPAALSFEGLRADAASLEALSRGLVAAAPSLRRLALSCAWAPPPEGMAALAAALPRLRALTRLDLSDGTEPGMPQIRGLAHALASHDAALSTPHVAAAVAAASAAVLDVRGCDEDAVRTAVAQGCRLGSKTPTTLLLGGSCLRARTAKLLRERLAPLELGARLLPSNTPGCASLTSLYVTHSRFDASDVFTVLSARSARLRALTLVTERPLPASVLSLAASALSPPPKPGVASGWPPPGGLLRLASFRLHAASFRLDTELSVWGIGGLEGAADRWRRVLACTVQTGEEEAGGSAEETTKKSEHAPPPLALLQLSSDASCAELLALRHAPHGAHVQLRLMRRDADFTCADEELLFAA